jgi:hypothetical protein
MSSSSTVMTPTSSKYPSAFWERLWLMSGIGFIAFFVIAYVIYGFQPQVGAQPDAVVSFYDGNRVRILIAVALAGPAILNLMWFVAALRTTLADAGQDGWGAAATTAGAMVGGLFLLTLAIVASLSYSIAGTNGVAAISSLNDLAWSSVVLSSFPRAMLIMSGTFGLWRAGLISNALFATGVVAVVLVLLGGTTWVNGGFWAPDGLYSRFVTPLIGLTWIIVVTRVLLDRKPVSSAAW